MPSAVLRCFAGSALLSTMNTCPTSVNTTTFPKWDLAEQHPHAGCQGYSDASQLGPDPRAAAYHLLFLSMLGSMKALVLLSTT